VSVTTGIASTVNDRKNINASMLKDTDQVNITHSQISDARVNDDTLVHSKLGL